MSIITKVGDLWELKKSFTICTTDYKFEKYDPGSLFIVTKMDGLNIGLLSQETGSESRWRDDSSHYRTFRLVS